MGQIAVYVGSRNVPVDTLDNAEKLQEVLDCLSHQFRGKNTLVRLLNENGDELMVGLGSRVGLVTLTPASRDAVYNALGDPDFVKAQSAAGFYWGEHWFEMGPGNLLPPAIARRIATRWVANGTRDDAVKWEVCPQRNRTRCQNDSADNSS